MTVHEINPRIRDERAELLTEGRQVIKTDITDSIHADLRREVQRRGSRFYRLERGTLMMLDPKNLPTSFYLDEEDATGQLLEGKPPKRRDFKTTKEMRTRRPHHTDDPAQQDIFE